MENKLPEFVDDFLQAQEKRVKLGLMDSQLYNRNLEMFKKLYDSSRNRLKDIKSGYIDNSVLIQNFNYNTNLFNKEILGDEIYDSIYKLSKQKE